MASSKLSAEDKKYIWHPFTQMQDWIANDQLIIEKGDGVYLFDTKGKKYIDGVSSLWVNVHGHNNKILNQAINKQLNKVAHSTLLGLANVPSIELAKKLVEIAPKGLAKVFYSDNGSTAVEVALKIAFQYWQQVNNKKQITNNKQSQNLKLKTKFITLENAYHGDTIGSVSVGGMSLFHQIYQPLLFKSFKTPAGNADALEKLMREHHAKIAAMIVEPLIQGAAGMLTMPKGYLKTVRKLCTKYNILLICDEVATGFGRTGKMFACQHENVSPDILCVAKGLTGGYMPIAATLTTKKVFNAFLGKPEENKTFFHGHTYTGNPLGCAVGIASLDLFKKNKLLSKVNANIKLINKELLRFKEIACVREVRQCGTMVGIEIKGYSDKDRIGHKIILEARRLGAILRPLGNVIVLMPPLCINKNELKDLLEITYKSIRIVTGC